MRIYLLYILITLTMFSCNEGELKPLNTLLSHAQLNTQIFEIDVTRDTVLQTSNGATVVIPKDAIASKNKIVKLELKEAFTIEDIFRAGLRTKSGDKLLSSGGMIYINAADAEIKNSISIKIPSNNYQKDMLLFEGVANNDGLVDWQSPMPLQENTMTENINRGAQIFRDNCASCHSITKDATGPPLAFIAQRRDKEWLKKFISNSAAMIASGDHLANCIFNQWNKTAMTSFPNLSDDDLEHLYAFLNEKSKALNPADYPDFQEMLDSCNRYFSAKSTLEDARKQLLAENGPEAKLTTSIPVAVNVSVPDNLVRPKVEQATFYEFSITTFGWYNVDAFMVDLPGFEQSELRVKINNKLEDVYNVFLILPEDKVCSDGGLLKGQTDWYGFYTDDGKISLPQMKQVYIIAFCERDDKISFALHPFVTQHQNIIEITANEITKTEMQTQLKTLKFDGFSSLVSDSKNASAIRTIDVDLQKLESLRPKTFNCNCNNQITVSDSVILIEEPMPQTDR